MNVQDMLKNLEERGYDVSQALVEVGLRDDIANAKVIISEKYRKVAGRARWVNGLPQIILARRLWITPGDAWKIVHETFLHELAHLFFPKEGHGYHWQLTCIKFGIKVERFHDYCGLKGNSLRLVAKCNCGKEYFGKRRLDRYRSYQCECGEQFYHSEGDKVARPL
jgi:predicted SprT family Zn-dependent metalloprotease